MVLNKIVNKFYYNSDIIFGILLIISGILALFLGFKIKNDRLIQVAAVLILGAITYLILRNRFPDSIEYLTKNEISKSKFIISSIIFYISLLLGMLIINQNLYSRPLSFLIVISLLSGFVAVQIISTNNKTYYYMILLEIIILSLVIRATVFFQFDGLIGGDPWVHSISINSIVTQGYVTNAVAGYYYFPFMHITSTFAYYLTGVSIKSAMFIVGLCESLSFIFIFLIVKKYFDFKLGLLSILILAVATYPVISGFLMIPQSFGIAYLSILIYLFFIQTTLESTYKKMVFTVFILIFLTCTILTHTINSLATLVILLAIYMVDFIRIKLSEILEIDIQTKHYITITLLALFFIFLMYYWMYSSGFIGVVGDSFKWGFSSTFQAPSVSTEAESFNTTLVKMLPLYLFSFIALIGLLFTLKIKSFKTINIYGWILLVFVFVLVFLGLNDFLPARWFIYIQICLIVPVVISVLALSRTTSKSHLILFSIIAVVAIVGLTSYEANAQNINPYTPYPNSGMKYSELVAFQTVYKLMPDDLLIYTDLGYHTNYRSNRIMDASEILTGKDNLNGVLLFRTGLINNSYYTSSLGGGHFSILPFDSSVLSKIDNLQKIYDSGTVLGYEGEG